MADYVVSDDATLVKWAMEGDHTAFEYLFNRYREALYRLFMHRTGRTADSDDLVQETFIKVFVNLHRYNPAYTFGQWVYTIARNTFIDYTRKRQDDLSLSDTFSQPHATTPTPEERVINAQQRVAIQRALQNMAEGYRQLIMMRFFDDYSYEQIASELQLPLGTVKTRIHRAREQMFKLFERGDR